MWIGTGLTLLTLAVQAVNFESVKSFENPQDWSDRLAEKCGTKALTGAFQARSLTDAGEIGFLSGAFYGVTLARYMTPKLLTGRVTETALWGAGCRLMLACLITAPWLLIPVLVKKVGVDDPYLLMVFKKLLPATLMSFSYFYIADLVNHRLGLLPKRQGKESQSDEEELDDQERLLDRRADTMTTELPKRGNSGAPTKNLDGEDSIPDHI